MVEQFLRNLFKRCSASPFARAVSKLASGQIIAAALPILAAPILGRLYRPEDYGALGLYMAIAGVLAPISTLQLHQGILAERSERRAAKLVTLSLRLSICFGIGSLPLVLFAYYFLADNPLADSRAWLFMLPATIAAGGLAAAGSYLANRRQQYGFLARNSVMITTVTVAISITLGYAGWGVNGLFVAYFAGQASMLVAHLSLLRNLIGVVPRLKMAEAVALTKRHRNFARFTLPAEFVGNLSQNIPVYALTAVGTPADIGNFARARQLVAMPLTLIGSSIAQVFRRRATEDLRDTGSCAKIYRRTFLALATIGLPATGIFMVLAPEIFRIVLGPNWTDAGRVAQVLAPAFLLQFVCNPLSTIFYVCNKQAEDFILSGFGLALLAVSFGAALTFSGTARSVLIAYSGSYCTIYAVYLGRGWAHAKPDRSVA